MKKNLFITVIALALSGAAMAVDKSNATIYSNFRYSLNAINEDGFGDQIDGIQGRDNISLFGVKGEYGNGNVKTFFHLQTQAFADGDVEGRAFKQRFYFGGLRGNFGTISFGRMTNAYKLPGFIMDPFYNLSHIGVSGSFAAGGANYGLSGASNGFTDNSLQYDSPVLRGVKLTGGLHIDDSNENDHGYIFGGTYKTKIFSIGGVFAVNGKITAVLPGIDQNGRAVRGHILFNKKSLKIGMSYENVDTGDENVNFVYTTSTVQIDEMKMNISASAGLVDAGIAEGAGFTMGVFYTIIENAQLFTIVSYAHMKRSDSNPFVISVGANYNFSSFMD